MKTNHSLIYGIACVLMGTCNAFKLNADDELDNFLKKSREEMEAFKEGAKKELEDFRKQANDELADFMKHPWPDFKKNDPIPVPVDPEPVIVVPEDDEPRPQPKPVPAPIKIEDVLTVPQPTPRPTPVSPINPVITPKVLPPFSVNFYGTDMSMKGIDVPSLTLYAKEQIVAREFEKLKSCDMDNLVLDCLDKRSKYRLCDWAYLQFVEAVANELYKNSLNAGKLLAGFILMQSGYDVRYCIIDGESLDYLFSSTGVIYDLPYIAINGRNYYLMNNSLTNNSIQVCDFRFPGEKPISFDIDALPLFAYASGKRQDLNCHGLVDDKN